VAATASSPRHQRTSASAPVTREVASSTIGWYCKVSSSRAIARQVAGHVEAPDHVRVHVRRVDLDRRRRRPWPWPWPRPRCAAPRRAGSRWPARRRRSRSSRSPCRRPGTAPRRWCLPAVRRARRSPGSRRVLHEHRELVAPPPRDGLLGWYDCPQPPRRLREHQITRAVPHQVVDRGEAVEVEEYDTRLAAPALGSGASASSGMPLSGTASASRARSST